MKLSDFLNKPTIFNEMIGHFRKLPEKSLVREVWHTHTKKHFGRFIHNRDLGYQAKKEMGYSIPQIYMRRSKQDHYRIKWLLVEDKTEILDDFAKIFEFFNVYTTLNHYPLKYAFSKLKIAHIEERYRLAILNSHIPSIASIAPEIVNLIENEKNKIPKQCWVDLAFDFDVGGDKEVKNINDAIPYVVKLIDFCKRYNIPNQVFFSGSKGFHLVVPYKSYTQTISDDNHFINRKITELIQEETGQLFIDPAIYSNRRQFRLPNTRHQKTGLFKVILTDDDLARGEDHIIQKARQPSQRPPVPTGHSEYLSNLYALAARDVRSRPKFNVTKNIDELQAARQSKSKTKTGKNGQTIVRPVMAIDKLHHPPCITQALKIGVVDTDKANRNQITVLLASYFKAIGRNVEESIQSLTYHALTILAQFSHSSRSEIENSTKTAVKTVFRHEKYHFNCRICRSFNLMCNDTCELFRSYQETASSRRLYKVELPDNTKGNNADKSAILSVAKGPLFDKVDDLRKDLTAQIKQYLADVRTGRYAKEKRIPPLLVKAPAGSGKTTTTFNTLANLNLRTLWVATRHDMYKNIPDPLKLIWRRIEGRHGEVKKKTGIFPANCHFPNAASRLREMRLNVNDHLCVFCKHLEGCKYFKQFNDKRDNWFVQQPMYLHKVKDFTHKFNVTVFDEDIMTQFIETISVNLHQVYFARTFIHKYIDELKDRKKLNQNVDYDQEIKNLKNLVIFLYCLENFMAIPGLSHPITGDILRRRIEEVYLDMQDKPNSKWRHPDNLEDLLEIIPPKIDNVIDQIYVDPHDEKQELPFQFLNVLLPVLRYEFFERQKDSNLSRLRFLSRRIKGKDGKNRFENILEITHKIKPPPLPTPTIILDATGKAGIYERLFDAKPIVYAPKLEFANRVIQVYSTSGSIGALRNAIHKSRMVKLLKYYLHEQPLSLVICKQSLENELRKIVPKGTMVNHYYGTRGSNEFEKLQRVIVFGMPGMNPETVRQYASAFYYQDNLSTDTEIVIRQYVNNDVGVKVLVYKEPLVQAIAETGREDEVLQSIHRIRPGLTPSKDIILLTNLVIPDLPVTQLVSVDDVLGRKKQDRKEKAVKMLRNLIEMQLDKIGFVCPARTLWPIIGNKEKPSIENENFMKSNDIWCQISKEKEMTKSTFYRHISAIKKDSSVSTYALSVKGNKGFAQVEIIGRNPGCQNKAIDFFSKHPEFKKERHSIIHT